MADQHQGYTVSNGALNASRPSLAARPSSYTETVSQYYTDDGGTVGSRTPRASMADDNESQYFQDARSFANVSSQNLVATPGVGGHIGSHATDREEGQNAHPETPLATPIDRSRKELLTSPGDGGAQEHPREEPPSAHPPASSLQSYTQESQMETPNAIDTPTLEAYKNDPEPARPANAVKALDMASGIQPIVQAEGGSTVPLANTSAEENTLAFAGQQAATESTLHGDTLLQAPATSQPEAEDSGNFLRVPTEKVEKSRPESTAVSMNGQIAEVINSSSRNDDSSRDDSSSGSSDKKKGKKDKSGKKGKKGDAPKKEKPEDSPDLAHFSDAQKKIILDQTRMFNEDRAVKYTDIYRFSTKFELALDFVGLIAAIASGVVQPLMTVLFGALTTAFVRYGTALATGQPTQQATDALYHEVNKDALLLLIIGIGMFCTTYIYMATWIYTGEQTAGRIRAAYLRSCLRQNIGFHDALGAGEVTTRLTSDMHLIQEGVSEKIPITAQFIATFFAGFVVAFIKNWRLTLVLSVIVPCIAGTGGVMAGFQAKYRTKMLAFIAEGGTLAEEVIASVRTSHAFGTQRKLAQLYNVPNEKALVFGRKTAVLTGAGLCTFFFIIYASYALAFFWGTSLILDGHAVAGEIITCFFAVLIGAFSLSQIAPNLQAVGYAIGAANKVLYTIWRVPPIDSTSDEGVKLPKVEGRFELRNVDFYYPSRPGVKVLKNYSAVFPSNQTTALVGASGCGKSSIVGLFLRFYNILGGSVTLDGHDIADLNVRWLRAQIGYVGQEPTLFASTIWENVAYGLINTAHESASEEVKRKLVKAACELANADEFISKLPEGYETSIGERGMLLSGGQKQRIAIARAVVSDPPILLLDEATSALDSASEVLVQKALDKASANRTTIVIAHRLSTIRDAANIIVMAKGEILEQGTHNDLLERQGAYATLVKAQELREEEQNEKMDDTDDAEADALLDKEAKEMPALGLKRTGTGQSEASQALERKNAEAEAHKPKERGMLYLLYRLIAEIWETKWYYFVGTIASVVVGMVYPVFSIVFGSLLGIYSATDRQELRSGGNEHAGYMFAVACVSALAILIQTYCFAYTSEYLSKVLRFKVFSKILAQDIAFFDEDKNSTGKLTSDISEQPQKVNALAGVTLGVIIQSIVTLIAGCIVGLSYAWKLSLVGIACLPLTLSAGIVRLRVVNLKDQKVRKAHEKSSQSACESAAAIRTVASLTREKQAADAYQESLAGPAKISNKIALISNVFFSISQALTFPVIALVFWYGSHQLVSEEINTKQFFIALTSVIFGSIQAGNVFTFVPDVSSAKGAAGSIIRLFDREIEIDADSPEGKPLQNAQGHIVFRNVHFRYPTRPGVRVLRGLNLSIQPGQFVALVGASGCGKSTLIQLAERFYDPLSGSVEIDGEDIRNYNVRSLRESISLVSQEPTLYDGSVRFNIQLGATTEVTQAQIEEACRSANIHDFIVGLPDGYDTLVGGKGSQLSGGQKQRIAIARALIRNPKILLLDEATSALDSTSEKVVQAALDAAAHGRTTIAVAHRLSTIQNADAIYVLRDGRVAEKGTHNELLAKKGIYHELVLQQALEKRK